MCDDAFVDRDYGPWAGKARAEVEARYGSPDRAPEIERLGSLFRRVVFTARTCASRFNSVVIVGHDVVNRALLARLERTSPTIPTRFLNARDVGTTLTCRVEVARHGH